ncbi:hypothetical protein TD95_003621 [Thielaviopsis punctulata]|uniref:Palmitoyltransferase n=1 Tax=Thielaviopsis punctulata TaxID=72032 RepID=A0A0F4ZC21_9PEZI|nr:hypothetical protein TD95_003621 [Thielaviopsis punctulata]
MSAVTAEMELGHLDPAAAGAGAGSGAQAPSPPQQKQPPPPFGHGGQQEASKEEADIMQLARVGDVAAMQALFEGGEVDATYHDDEGITPLHWAAINNQYAMCKFLISAGAEINRKGGESVSTPLQWAAQRCHYYTVNLLLHHGADPLITDSQGYNTLHISTFNGNVLLLVLLLHQGIPVDVLDSFGHTALMWAAYKGFPRCVDVLLRWGASVHATDEQGFTALHWALVKGSPQCILKLLEYGADRFAPTATGKTPALTAAELNTVAAWHRALRESGYAPDGSVARPPWPGAALLLQNRRGFVSRFLFLWPFALVWAAISVLAYMPVFAAVPLAAVVCYGIMWVAQQQVLEYAPADMRHFSRTPWMAGIFAATLFWTGLNWLFTVLPVTGLRGPSATHGFLNLVFAGCYALVVCFYVAAMVYDPGFVPRLKGIAEQKAVIDELLSEWKFDEANFCVTCMVRTPLRSKHCKRCGRCVAKHDHHCPWVNNCIGVNNHRQFFLYILSLAAGILCYDVLLYHYFTTTTESADSSCSILSPALCQIVNADAYTLLLGIWISIQLVWVSMLISVQFIQVARAMTTFENMFGIRDASATLAFTSTGQPLDPQAAAVAAAEEAEAAATVTAATAATAAAAATAGPGLAHAHARRRGGYLSQIAMLLGITPFIETVSGRTAGGAARARKKGNPYGHGCVANCSDFWCDPAPVLGRRETGAGLLAGRKVSWMDMYEVESGMGVRTRGRGRGRGYEAVGGEEEV